MTETNNGIYVVMKMEYIAEKQYLAYQVCYDMGYWTDFRAIMDFVIKLTKANPDACYTWKELTEHKGE